MMENLIWLIPICLVCYVIGNINFSVIISKRKMKKDIRHTGSGNAGTTNMLRAFGFKWAVIILFLDIAKGVATALVGYGLFGFGSTNGTIALFSCGLASVLGHCFPVFYKFRGGKGVATMVGVFMVASPVVAIIAFLIGVIYVFIWEYAAVSSIIFVSTVITHNILIWGDVLVVALLLCGFYFLFCFMHRKNILRLLRGTENKASPLKKLKTKNIAKKQEEWIKEVNA